MNRPPLRYMIATANGPDYSVPCDPCNVPCDAEWRVVTRYSHNGIADECAWVQWASNAEDARALARHSRATLLPTEGIVYQTILRVEDGRE